MGLHVPLPVVECLGSDDALFDALEAAEEAHLIHPESAGRETIYKFSHELIRQTLVGRLSIPRRQRLHLRISNAMEEVYASRLEDHAADYSYHLYQAGAAADPDTTIRFLTLAGEQALETAAFEEALEHFELGLSVLDDPEPAQLGISAACGREWEVAEGHFRTALAEAHEIPYRTEQPEVRRWYAWMLLERDEPGDRERATELLNEAIPMFEELGMVGHAELARGMLG